MKPNAEHVTHGAVRVVRVPYSKIGRFNKRFEIDKSSYDGRFKSRLGIGYCTAAQPFHFMSYTFTEASA